MSNGIIQSDQSGPSTAAEAVPPELPPTEPEVIAPAARILLADDHELVRKGLASILDEHPDWEVCGQASDGREAVAMAAELKPDVVIMDIGMPRLNGLEASRQIVARLPKTEIVILTVHDSDNLVREVLDAGARGYVLKSDASSNLKAAVESALDHKPFLTSSISGTLLRGCLGARSVDNRGPRHALTPREREVLQLLAEGNSNKEVARVLEISIKTADTHRTNIMRKLEVHSVTELVRYAVRTKLVHA